MGKVYYGSVNPSYSNFKYCDYDDYSLFWSEEQISKVLAFFKIRLLEWQMTILKTLLRKSKTEQGSKLLIETLGLLVPRQNGKTEILVAYIIICLFMGRSGVYSSYRLTSSDDVYSRTYNAIKDSIFAPVMKTSSEKATTKFVSLTQKGKESSFIFSTRRGGFGRGLTKKDVIIFDEAQEVTESQVSTVEALLTVSSTPQMLFMGTPALPETDLQSGKTIAANPFWGELKQKIIQRQSLSHLWLEWSCESIQAPGNLEVAAKYNPSLGYDLGNGYKMSITPFMSSVASNLNYSIERLGYQLDNSIFSNKPLLPLNVLDKVLLSKDQIHEMFKKERKYAYVVKSNQKNSQVYVSKITSFKGKYFCALVGIYSLSDSNALSNLLSEIVKENQTYRCGEIIIDGNIRSVIGSHLQKIGKIKKSGQSFGKFKFIQVKTVHESAQLFESAYNNNNVFFCDFMENFLKDYLPNVSRRKVREGFSFVSSTHDHELLETFALGVFSMSKLP